ncbi:glycerophosphodiester phosphodiesterase family protein [Pedobacter sp. MC2016-24]|uniref:glycerophosphodiester phosphodiesterase family protein n=1 Tax=Pedobacter sp. MC2016-24 TaxID=2780090 RepID=UPI0018820F46|nr:glycerophosphodiester phosphodiesterase family protein [Pedobacter sp. MC2016-24]MBE9600824.1 alpha/beta hydrolase fold domain-containing protein [Pedobacter sp. MC2016-24]
MKRYQKLSMFCLLMILAISIKAQNYRKLQNIAYSRDSEENKFDAYLPDKYENAQVIVYLHGSGWTGGDKNELPGPLIEQLVAQQYIVVSANYRLIKDGKNRFPTQMEDVKNLLGFLSANAKKYNYDGKQFTLMGGSAGGHLAMLFAYGYDPEKKVKTVIDFWGPTDLTDQKLRAANPEANDKIVNLLGISDPAAKIGFDASPYYRLTKNTGVPTLIFHGGKDPLVDVSQADKLYKKLKELDVPAQYEYYPNEKHGMKGAAAMDVLVKTLAWLKKYDQPIARLPKSKNGFIVVAHRGSHLVKPENTIASIEDAISLGADYAEIDLRTTKDGHLILSHNETVDSRTNGKGRVQDLTWAELAKLQVKSRDGKIHRIPDFAEALNASKGKINIYLDFKDADPARAYEQIKAAGMENNVLVYLNKANHYADWRKIAPMMPLMSGLPEYVKTREDLLEFGKKMSLQAVDNATDPTLMTALREAGIAVFLDAQSADENPVKWLKIINTGVQGMQTDHPEALIQYLNAQKLRDGVSTWPVK